MVLIAIVTSSGHLQAAMNYRILVLGLSSLLLSWLFRWGDLCGCVEDGVPVLCMTAPTACHGAAIPRIKGNTWSPCLGMLLPEVAVMVILSFVRSYKQSRSYSIYTLRVAEILLGVSYVCAGIAAWHHGGVLMTLCSRHNVYWPSRWGRWARSFISFTVVFITIRSIVYCDKYSVDRLGLVLLVDSCWPLSPGIL